MTLGFRYNESGILLIERTKIGWAQGLVTGLGGKLVGEETIEEGMAREFTEESGIPSSADEWQHVATLNSGQTRKEMQLIYVCMSYGSISGHNKNCPEGILRRYVELPPNIEQTHEWLIPMLFDNSIQGWIVDHRGDERPRQQFDLTSRNEARQRNQARTLSISMRDVVNRNGMVYILADRADTFHAMCHHMRLRPNVQAKYLAHPQTLRGIDRGTVIVAYNGWTRGRRTSEIDEFRGLIEEREFETVPYDNRQDYETTNTTSKIGNRDQSGPLRGLRSRVNLLRDNVKAKRIGD